LLKLFLFQIAEGVGGIVQSQETVNGNSGRMPLLRGSVGNSGRMPLLRGSVAFVAFRRIINYKLVWAGYLNAEFGTRSAEWPNVAAVRIGSVRFRSVSGVRWNTGLESPVNRQARKPALHGRSGQANGRRR